MATWLQLKQQVFELLDLPTTTSGDVASSVENRLQSRIEQIAQSVRLPDLFVETSAVNLVGPAKSLALVADFSVSDLQEIYAVQVDRDPTNADSEFETWEEMSHKAYVNSMTVFGNKRPEYRFVHARSSDVIYFTSYPETGETWEAKVIYYKSLAAYNDANSPELPTDYHSMLAYGTAALFPHYFMGDRKELLQTYAAFYNTGVKNLQREMRESASLKRRSSRVRHGVSSAVKWGNP